MAGYFPWLTLLIFLPLAGAGALYFAKDTPARMIALGVTVADFIVALPLWWLFDPSSSQMQFIEHVAWITSPPIHYSLGIDGISLPLILMTAGTHAALRPGFLEAITTSVRGFMAVLLRDGNGHAGRLRRIGLCAVLCILGSDADPDVPAHRRLGRAQPALCGHQVLSLHLGRQRAPAWSPSSCCTFMAGTRSTSSRSVR